MNNKGRIVFINGVSSSGKSTLAQALQTRMPEPCYKLSLDLFTDISSMRYDKNPNQTLSKTFTLFHNTIRMFSDHGANVIVDHILLKPLKPGEASPIDECFYLLRDYPVLFICAHCSLGELKRREQARKDRTPGMAERQLEHIYPADRYDFTVDTSAITIDECASRVMDFYLKNVEPCAFAKAADEYFKSSLK